MKKWNQVIGKKGEDLAAAYLSARGVNILARNQRTQYGEINLVGFQKDTYIFIEVKTRTSMKYGFPELAITESKLQHMIDCATEYMQTRDIDTAMRIDVISIVFTQTNAQPEMEWIQNVTR